MGFEAREERRGEEDVLVVVGEIDVRVFDVLSAHLEKITTDGRPRAVIDIAGVTFIDSMGLRAFVGASNVARASGVPFVLIGQPERVLRTFQLAGVSDLFEFED